MELHYPHGIRLSWPIIDDWTGNNNDIIVDNEG